MPSSPKSTLVPLRRATRERLSARKGEATFDAQILALLDAAPYAVARTPPTTAARAPEPEGRRSPSKQLLLRELAREAWAARVLRGEITLQGARLMRWDPPGPTRGRSRVDQPERRAFAP